MADIAAIFGFAGGLVVGYAIAQIRVADKEACERQGFSLSAHKAARMKLDRMSKYGHEF